jgi:hypothetical protein
LRAASINAGLSVSASGRAAPTGCAKTALPIPATDAFSISRLENFLGMLVVLVFAIVIMKAMVLELYHRQ